MASKKPAPSSKDNKKTTTKKPAAAAKPAAKAPAKKPLAAKKPAPAKAPATKPAASKPAPAKPAAKAKPETAKTAPQKINKLIAVKAPGKKGKGGLAGGIRPYQAQKGESYMSDAQKVHFRALLLAWKAELMEEVDRTVTHMKDEAANFPDPADRATQEEEFSLELRARDRERKLIKKIDSTLELIEQDDYGYCEACGIEIGVERLEVRPTATLCIDCKTLAEIKEKQLGT